jgi:hypothetical protein
MAIRNAELLTDIFGEWPSFHDAYLLSVTLESGEPTLTMQIRLFGWTGEVDDKGYYVHDRHTLATLSFHYVALTELRYFNEGNIVSDIEINDIENDPLDSETSRWMAVGGLRHHVRLGATYGCQADFCCRDIEVVSVEPYTAPEQGSEGGS